MNIIYKDWATMSIYSGFPTRKDQTSYNNLLQKLIQTLQNHLLELIQAHSLPFNKSHLYEKIIIKMRQFEQHKYLEPKFSEVLQPLATLIGLPDKLDIIPEHTFSRMYVSASKDRSKGDTTHSHSVFSSKKGSNVIPFHQDKQTPATEGKSVENLWHTKTKLNTRYKNERETKNSRSTAKKTNYHQSFYYIHEKKLAKINHLQGKKPQDERNLKESSNHSGKVFKNGRSITEIQQSKWETNPREFCIDLKVLKEAEKELKKAQRQDKYYCITQQVVYDP